MAGSYNYGLVALSILIAMLGLHATINLAERVKASHGESRLSWRIGGATVMAIVTWAMHYTGMLAFNLPVPIRYQGRNLSLLGMRERADLIGGEVNITSAEGRSTVVPLHVPIAAVAPIRSG